MCYVICYIEGKPRFSDFQYIKYPLLQDTHIYQIQKCFEIAVPQSHWLDNEASDIFPKQTVNSIQPHKVTAVCVNGPILTYRKLHTLWDYLQKEENDQRSHFQSQKCGSSQRDCIEGIQNYIGSSCVKSAYCSYGLLCNLLWSGGCIQPVVYILSSSSITKEHVRVFSMAESYAALSV